MKNVDLTTVQSQRRDNLVIAKIPELRRNQKQANNKKKKTQKVVLSVLNIKCNTIKIIADFVS